jgi:hypothetical protein
VLWDRAEVGGRLDVLRRADPGFTRFGAAAHHYLLNQPLPQSEVTAFEARYGLSLPGEYRSFLLEVGDGGADPFYGIFRLDRSGPQRGTLWEDGRCSDTGITPFAPGFAAWYLQWLNDPQRPG